MVERISGIPAVGIRYLTVYNLALGLVMAIAALAMMRQGFQLPAVLVWGTVLAQAVLVAGLGWLSQRQPQEPDNLSLGILLISIVDLSVYLYATGGHTNPVISLLLVPLALSAVLLRWQKTLLLATIVVALYTLLTTYYIPLSVGHGDGAHSSLQHESFMQLHLLGMWLTFAVSALLICVLVIPLARSVRRQQQLISQQREKILQDEQLVALATFATSAAHNMGTPLSTLSILVEDFRELVEQHPDWQEDRDLMAQQIELCKTILQAMMRKADDLRHKPPQAVEVSRLLNQLREQFNLLHPQFSLALEPNTGTGLSVLADATLEQAILNLLDNAVRASGNAPELQVSHDEQRIVLRIQDSGPGIPERIQQQLGGPFVTSTKGGLGLGLFLSHATVERLGGELTLHSSDQGTVMKISLPLMVE